MARGPSMSTILLLVLCVGTCVDRALSQGSMMRKEARETRMGKSSLQAAVERVLEGEAAQQLFAVEASVRPTYEAFPKNSMGRIPTSEIFPAIVRSYFAKEHGWLIKGLEPPHLAPRLTEVHEAAVLREHAPALAGALEALHRSDLGLSLGDVVGTIAALERLVLDESKALLHGAYALNELQEADPLDADRLNMVLYSYLLLFRHGHPHNFTDISGHRGMRSRAERGSDWDKLVKFAQDAVQRTSLSHPYTFAAVSGIVKELALAYGKWQNGECMQMKEALMDMGSDGPGSVPLERFHAEPKHANFQFTESAAYLRKTGTLEEPAEGQPRVRIANYLLGPSNCIASSQHYSVCCLNECEALMREIEQSVQAPVWPAQRLLDLVASVPSSSLEVPRQLAPELAQELHTIAGHHGTAVPLHSAEFRRWLHRAFPNECPEPTAAENAAEESQRMAAQEWLAVQQECTRIPPWHPSAQGEVLSV